MHVARHTGRCPEDHLADIDPQYAFARPIAEPILTHDGRVRKVDGEVGAGTTLR